MKKAEKPVFDLGAPTPAEEVFYWRVSTGRDQDPDFQIALAKKRGIQEGNIFGDVMSGRKTKRPGLELALKLMTGRPGWTLVIWKLDRLGRDTEELMRLSRVFRENDWNLVSMTEGIDTKTPMGKAFYGMLAVFAQFESDTTAERSKAGMMRRKELGFNIGRKTQITKAQFAEIERRLIKTKEPIPDIAKRIKIKGKSISPSTINHHFPGWRGKLVKERVAWRKLHPLPESE
jgi:DNA invertase Pin-like site-specific DNA recombinase